MVLFEGKASIPTCPTWRAWGAIVSSPIAVQGNACTQLQSNPRQYNCPKAEKYNAGNPNCFTVIKVELHLAAAPILVVQCNVSSLYWYQHHFHSCSSFHIILINIFLINLIFSRRIHNEQTCLSLLPAFPSNSFFHNSFAYLFTDSLSNFCSLSGFESYSGCSKPCSTSTQTSITSILSLLVKSTPQIFLHGDCSVCPKMHSVNAPHLSKRHVRPWVHDPGTLTDVCLMLTLGNPSPAYPCTHAYPPSPGRK